MKTGKAGDCFLNSQAIFYDKTVKLLHTKMPPASGSRVRNNVGFLAIKLLKKLVDVFIQA
ncbi:hypothetical protein SDC9_107784 [bioreactor metagenome]|uniref:Uncharacterized protein n=1 Tax=bioreactor metagenome TaxID=1076179 RepID=A0A645B660_9ZZZZ